MNSPNDFADAFELGCAGCVFFHRAHHTFNHGDCRRHAPRPGDSYDEAKWPKTMASQCGEFVSGSQTRMLVEMRRKSNPPHQETQ